MQVRVSPELGEAAGWNKHLLNNTQILFHLQKKVWCGYYPHFKDKGTETQRGKMRVLKTEPRSMCPMDYNLVSYLHSFPRIQINTRLQNLHLRKNLSSNNKPSL